MDPARIENDAVRYAVSFLAVLACVVAAVAAAVLLPSSVPNHGLVAGAIIVLGGLVGVYLMVRIEEGQVPLRRRFEDVLR